MKKFLEEFKEFALKGNVMSLAIGVIIGGALQSLVTSFTDCFITFVIFVIMKGINAIMDLGKKKEEAAPLTRKCPYCMGEIDIKATKCMHCTSDVPPAQE